MVDTGASRSFITQRLLGTLHHSQTHSTNSTAQLGDGHTKIKLLGEVQLTIKVNHVFTTMNVLVVKTLNADFILGGDWCTKYGAEINYDTNQVSIRSSDGRTYTNYDKQIDNLTLNVQLVNSIKIPSRESCIVQAKLELSSADTVYIHPDFDIQQDKSILMSSALLHIHNYTTFLTIYNSSDYTRTLYMNSLLGHVTHTPSNIES
ncbi:unnamed protein product, partial [Didymodactylos carnosus]